MSKRLLLAGALASVLAPPFAPDLRRWESVWEVASGAPIDPSPTRIGARRSGSFDFFGR
jgi:hypothetical protein